MLSVEEDCECQSCEVKVASLQLLCALSGLIHQILSYIHQFNTSTFFSVWTWAGGCSNERPALQFRAR